MINQLITKIFHDIGNAIVPLNFFIELNRDDPKNLDFQELMSVNRQILLSFNVLKYAFLPDKYGEKAMLDLVEYFQEKEKLLKLNIDYLEFSEDYFRITIHTLMVLNKILNSNSEISVTYKDGTLKLHCIDENLEKEKLKILNNLSSEDNINIIYVNSVLKKLGLRMSYDIVSDKEFVINYSN